jgi:mRNA interferase YafQ
MTLLIKTTARFRKEVKIAKKRGLDLSLLRCVLVTLASQKLLPPEYRDHALFVTLAG